VDGLGVAGVVPPADFVLEPEELLVDELEVLVLDEEEVVDVAPGSGVKGLRVGPPRWWEEPLVVSATGCSGFAGDWLTAMPETPGETGAVEVAGVLPVEPPPPSTA